MPRTAAAAKPAPAKPPPERSPLARLEELVGTTATELLANAEAVTAEKLADKVREASARVVDAAAKEQGDKLLRRLAKKTLKRRADDPLQQELDLGIPDGWTLRCRRDDGSVYYVIAAEATEDDLLAAEEERKHQVKQAEARVANAEEGARRALERAEGDLARIRELLGRLARSAGS